MKIIELKNYSSETPFASPQTTFFIGEGEIVGVNFEDLSNFFLQVENELCPELNKDSIHTGNLIWGLREGNIISKNVYNFFKLNYFETTKILNEIKRNYFLFLEKTNTKVISSYLDCGINIMRNGEFIPIHLHDISSHSYLTGTIIVDAKNTSTNFVHPCNQTDSNKDKYIEYRSENEVGKVVFFPSCLPHYVETYYGEKERMLLSFDIISKNRNIKNIINYQKRLIEFIL